MVIWLNNYNYESYIVGLGPSQELTGSIYSEGDTLNAAARSMN